jgi:hypothetical protein
MACLDSKEKIGIIGNGDFGKFLEKHLSQFFEIEIFIRKDLTFDFEKKLKIMKKVFEFFYKNSLTCI